MATTYTWTIAKLDCYPEHEGNTDVVFNAHWLCNGADGEYAGNVYGTQALTLDPGADFTPFADLTEAQVIGWVKDALGEEAVAALEANVAEQIETAKNPPVVNPALPWG